MIDLFIARDIETIRSQQEQIKREEDEEKNAQEGGKVEESKPVQNAGDEDWWNVSEIDHMSYLNSSNSINQHRY